MSLAPRLACGLLMLVATLAQAAGVSVVDDTGITVTLPQPARRIITLSPHAAELVHAAGAGSYLIGAAEFSNYPPAVTALPSVGGSAALDIERILSLKPDLVVAWASGNSAKQLALLKQLGLTIYYSEPRDFETIATSLERLSHLTGTEKVGRTEASAFRQRWQALAARYQDRRPVRVFYQIWRAPLMTLNDSHLVSEALRLCGGRNIFGHLSHLAPTVSMEAVVQADPQAIITTGEQEDDPFLNWRRITRLTAVKHNHLFLLDGDVIHRASPRILVGTEMLCQYLEKVRQEDFGSPSGR